MVKSQMKPKNNSSESQEQQGFITWFRYKYPSVIIFHIPNGGFRDMATAQKLKKDGVVPGIPDLFIPKFKIFIEMKKKEGGTISKEQKVMMEYLERVGYKCIVGYGATDASVKLMELIK